VIADDAAMAVLLAVLAAAALVIAVRSTLQHRRLVEAGVPGTATIIWASETEVVVDDRPVLCLDLRVEVDGVAPYDARSWTVVPAAALGLVRPGARVGVRVDPTAPTTLAVDLSRLSITPAALAAA
jgi:hypothetical protein